MVLISVIITCKNAKETIIKTIESLMNQTCQDFEVIVVDAFSSDGTYELLKKIATKWPKLKIYRYEGNPAAGRNYAIVRAKGKYIAFIDADAYADRRWLETMVNFFRKLNGLKVAGLGGPGLLPPDSSFISKCIDYFLRNKFLTYGTRNFMLQKNIIEVDHHPFYNAFFDRKIFLEVGLLNEKLDVCEDVEFGYRVRKKGYKLLYIPSAIVYHYRRSSIISLAKQMFSYGYWRGLLRKISYKLIFPVYFLPSLIVILLFSSIIFIISVKYIGKMSTLVNLIGNLCIALSSIYLLCIKMISIANGIKLRSFKAYIYTFIAGLTVHISYGIGFIYSLVKGREI